MPVFRITYDIVAPDKASAERHARYSDRPNAYFKVRKVMGPKPRKRWVIIRNNLVLDAGYGGAGLSKTQALKNVRSFKAVDTTHKYAIREI